MTDIIITITGQCVSPLFEAERLTLWSTMPSSQDDSSSLSESLLRTLDLFCRTNHLTFPTSSSASLLSFNSTVLWVIAHHCMANIFLVPFRYFASFSFAPLYATFIISDGRCLSLVCTNCLLKILFLNISFSTIVWRVVYEIVLTRHSHFCFVRNRSVRQPFTLEFSAETKNVLI